MSKTETVWIKGPMHPDLFDGETPVMQQVPVASLGKVFIVTVEYTRSDEEEYTVMALDEDDARTAASDEFFKEFLQCDYDIDFIKVSAADSEPDDSMINDFIARTSEKVAA